MTLDFSVEMMTRGGLSSIEESRCFVLQVIMTCGGVSLVMELRRFVLWVIMTCDIFFISLHRFNVPLGRL